MGIFKRKRKIDMSNIPAHIGFIMDGNGRWAKRRGLPRSMGHREGVFAMRRVCEACRDFGVKTVTVYALSTENLNRSEKEVKFIFDLVVEFVNSELKNAISNDLKINVIGNLDHPRLPLEVKNACVKAMEETKECKTYVLNIAFMYGGRDEIVRAVNGIIKDGKTEITEEEFSNYIYTAGQADPDLIVRASGEQRISNFLLWQIAYSEFYFPKTYWPDFNKKTVEECILAYQSRKRRFGKVLEN